MATSSITGSLVAQAQTSLLQSRANQTLQQVQSAQAGNNNDARIEKSAKEFEAMLLGTWLQQAEQSMATVPGVEDDEEMAGREQMMSLGVQSLATSLSSSGGIGIASMIAKSLHSIADRGKEDATTKVTSGEDYLGKTR